MLVSYWDIYAKAVTDYLDIKLKLDKPGYTACRKAYDSMLALDPREWDISFKFNYSKPSTCTVTLTNTSCHPSLGELTLREFPKSPSEIDLDVAYEIARRAFAHFSYDKFIERIKALPCEPM